MRSLLTFVFALVVTLSFAGNPAYKIEINVTNYESDTIVTGYYFADRQLVLDTVIRQDGIFTIAGEEPLKGGMYLAIFQPNNDFIQFMVNAEEQSFKINVNAENRSEITFEGSKDNELFYNYINFIQSKNKEAEPINAALKAAQEAGVNDEGALEKMEILNNQVKSYQEKIVNTYPHTITARLLQSNWEIDMPEFSGTDQEIQSQRYQYYKQHFFDNIDLGDSINLRTPYLHQRITQYVEKLTPQIPDSIIYAVDRVLQMSESAPETFRFYVSHFLNTYAKNKIVGMDKVYVHLVDKYYSAGKADWVDEETLIKLEDNARMLRPTLIGKKAQDISVMLTDSTTMNLYDIDADYTVLYFYAYDCPHCKKSTPHLVDFYQEWKDKGVRIMTICTKRDRKEWINYLEKNEMEMDGFYNAWDPINRSRYRIKYDVRTTPKIYLMNKDWEILIKNFPAEEINAVMEDVIRIENEKKEMEGE